MRMEWPLFSCLKPGDQEALMKYQWDTYNTLLDFEAASRPSQEVVFEATMENLEEIDHLMRQAPSRSRGKE